MARKLEYECSVAGQCMLNFALRVPKPSAKKIHVSHVRNEVAAFLHTQSKEWSRIKSNRKSIQCLVILLHIK